MEVEEGIHNNSVRVGYYDPFNLYAAIKKDLESNLPLSNLHWKFHPSKPLKSIASLPISLIEEIPNTKTEELNKNIIDDVYLRIMIVKIDNLEFYRSQVRPLIKEWLKKLVLERKIEWMIVLYVPSSVKDKNSTLIKTSSFDKLKVDFGYNGKEWQHIAKVPVYKTDDDSAKFIKIKEQSSNESEKSESYTDLTSKLKELLISSFNERFQEFNRRLAQSKASPLEKFINNLSLGNLFNDMRLYQDALDIFQSLKSESLLNEKLDYSIKALPKSFENYKFFCSTNPASCFTEDAINLFQLKLSLFAAESGLLQNLANSAVSVSISSLFVINLFQKLIYYVNDVSDTFKSADLDEFIFSIVDSFIELPIYQRLIEILNDTDDDTISLNDIYEFRGELKLSQRTALINLASKRGFNLQLTGQFEDVSLTDDQNIDKPVKELQLTNRKLLKALSSENEFQDYFENITESTIQEFSKCSRLKSIDILSIDLALLKYQRGDYEEALNIIEESFDVYISNGWSFMGSFLLDVYLQCLLKVESSDSQRKIFTGLKLISCLKVGTAGQVGINNYSLLMNPEKVESLFQSIKDTCLEQDELIDYPLDALFEIELYPYIEADDSCSASKYYLEVMIVNKFEIPFDFEEINVHLDGEEYDDQLSFNVTNITLEPKKSQKIKVYSNFFKSGIFTPTRVTVRINENLELSQEFGSVGVSDDPNHTVIHFGDPSIKPLAKFRNLPQLLYYQNMDKLWCEFLNSKEIKLGTTSAVLRIHNGKTKLKNLRVDLVPRTEGLNLELNGVDLDIKEIGPGQSYDIEFPLKYFSDNKVVVIGATIKYNIKSEIYSHSLTASLDTTLTMAVSVQDIFRPHFIYSNFSVGTSSPKYPIRLISSLLTTSNENYTIEKPKKSLSALIAFGEQPAGLFFKIIPKPGYSITATDTFDLILEYSNLRSECSTIVQNQITERLKELGLLKYWHLMKVQAIDKLKYDLNNYGINKFIQILNGKELFILIENIILKHVQLKSDQILLLDLFSKIVDEHIDVEELSLEDLTQELHISVAIPYLKHLHIVEAKYERKQKYIVGEPISVKLLIQTETKWYNDEFDKSPKDNGLALAESSPSPSTSASESSHRENFQLSIQNDDGWLISGFKKYSFDLTPYNREQIHEIDLVIIPLTVGKVLLPRCVIKGSQSNTEDDLDTLFKNGQETLLVVPQLDSITFSF
ncbi:trafficking protein particle complex subunit 10 [Scheffersomyces coipomensis]|uniref:trafficking protein particle complex subunit 10 n=1 Tax=Scheffersomyces coipomensis TaxID=1788519 RepID=UPI00315C5665